MSEPQAARKKNYVLDTNVLIENPQCLLTLRNGVENDIFVPYHVLMELEAWATLITDQHLADAGPQGD